MAELWYKYHVIYAGSACAFLPPPNLILGSINTCAHLHNIPHPHRYRKDTGTPPELLYPNLPFNFIKHETREVEALGQEDDVSKSSPRLHEE